MADLERTCWRGMQVHHPPEWEIAIASGLDEPGRCSFVDRHYQRLDVRWRPVRHVPNLDLMLDKFRRRTGKDVSLEELSGVPSPWRGVVRRTEDAQVVHAGRFFKEVRRLVEATIVWPGRRDTALEKAILASIAPEDPACPLRQWWAIGIRATVPTQFELVRSSAKVGRVRWDFAGPKNRPVICVERIALVEHWLKTPLRDWLQQELAPSSTVLRYGPIRYNGHPGEMLLSRSRAGIVSSLRGLRRLRLDLAWQCPIDGRLYHVSRTEVTGQEEIVLPQDLKIQCCGSTALATGGPTA